jgi:hypothetical protein
VKVADINKDHLRLSGFAAKIGPILAVVGVLFLALSAALGSGEWTAFWKSYLFGWMVAVGIALGAMFFVLLQHMTRSGWSITVRRLAEAMAKNLKWMWMLFVPILVLVLKGSGDLLYQWGDTELMEHDHMLHAKATYLSSGFWSIRAVAYLLIWAVIATLYFRWSTAQDRDGDVKWTHKMQKWAPLCMILYALSQSYASIDWIMTLQPKWFSTMFAVYFFSATMAGFFAMMILLARFLQKTGHVQQSITTEHYHDLGKWLFGLGVVFWAYIGFSQYMLIWYANLPVETGWYITRQLGGWVPISLLLLFGHFLFPFLLLITRWTKRWRCTLPAIAVWMVLMFFVDIYWLVFPVIPETAMSEASSYNQLVEMVSSGAVSVGYGFTLVNFTCLIGMFALFCGGTMINLRSCNLVASSDPRLDEALHFENA